MVNKMLSVQGLCVAYGQVKAVHEVSLQLKKGETVALLGVNGAGKTTLLLALAGILKPVSGTILYDCGGSAQTDTNPHARKRIKDVSANWAEITDISVQGRLRNVNANWADITNMSVQGRIRDAHANLTDISHFSVQERVRLGISLVPEGRHVFSSATVHENLLIGAHIRKDSGVDADVGRMYRLFPALYEKRNSAAMSLSGGQQQMLAIARALMSRPRLLLLDEPTMGLSPKLCAEVYTFIEKGSREGLTVLVSGEDGRSLRAICDRSLTLVNGVLRS